MKKIFTTCSVLALALGWLLGAVGCQQSATQPEQPAAVDGAPADGSAQETAATGIWANATYTADTTLGEGAKTLTVVVAAEDKSITFTVKTDKETVGAALEEHGLITGADGLYTVVNGMTADYNVDQTYWAFYLGDAYATEGMDTTAIDESVTYKLERAK